MIGITEWDTKLGFKLFLFMNEKFCIQYNEVGTGNTFRRYIIFIIRPLRTKKWFTFVGLKKKKLKYNQNTNGQRFLLKYHKMNMPHQCQDVLIIGYTEFAHQKPGLLPIYTSETNEPQQK